MNIFLILLAIFNIALAIISVVPCLVGGAMGMDSPQAQNDPVAITLCILFLTFPIVCLVCGITTPILGYFEKNILALIFGFFPIIEAASVILFMLFLGEK